MASEMVACRGWGGAFVESLRGLTVLTVFGQTRIVCETFGLPTYTHILRTFQVYLYIIYYRKKRCQVLRAYCNGTQMKALLFHYGA